MRIQICQWSAFIITPELMLREPAARNCKNIIFYLFGSPKYPENIFIVLNNWNEWFQSSF